jgi:hypothetical protein
VRLNNATPPRAVFAPPCVATLHKATLSTHVSCTYAHTPVFSPKRKVSSLRPGATQHSAAQRPLFLAEKYLMSSFACARPLHIPMFSGPFFFFPLFFSSRHVRAAGPSLLFPNSSSGSGSRERFGATQTYTHIHVHTLFSSLSLSSPFFLFAILLPFTRPGAHRIRHDMTHYHVPEMELQCVPVLVLGGDL